MPRVFTIHVATVPLVFTIHVADSLPRVIYVWQTISRVFHVPRGTVATCIYCTRGKLYISQQPDLPGLAHVANSLPRV